MDNHTRSVCVRGGSNYRPAGSGWYFPNEPDLLTHNKCESPARTRGGVLYTGLAFRHTNLTRRLSTDFLMNPRYERAGTIGFRCAADVAP